MLTIAVEMCTVELIELPMPQKFHFTSGLPRSGSTLLAGILRQNPRFHAAMSSPVAGLVIGALEQMGAASESYSFFDKAKRKSVFRPLFNVYCEDKSTQQIIFATNAIVTLG